MIISLTHNLFWHIFDIKYILEHHRSCLFYNNCGRLHVRATQPKNIRLQIYITQYWYAIYIPIRHTNFHELEARNSEKNVNIALEVAMYFMQYFTISHKFSSNFFFPQFCTICLKIQCLQIVDSCDFSLEIHAITKDIAESVKMLFFLSFGVILKRIFYLQYLCAAVN